MKNNTTVTNSNKIAVCAAHTALGKAYIKTLNRYQIEVVSISNDDFDDVHELARKINGCYALCYISATPLLSRWTTRSQMKIVAERVTNLRALATAIDITEQKPRAFICVSNAMQYDQYEVHDDFSTCLGQSFFAEVGNIDTRITAEICSRHKEMRILILRMGFVMCKNGGAFTLMRNLSRVHMGGAIGDGYQCLPMVHINDAARALFQVTTDESCYGIYNVTIPEIASMQELVDALGKMQIAVPKFIIDFFAGRAAAVTEQNCKVIPTRLLQEKFKFEFPNVELIVEDLLG